MDQESFEAGLKIGLLTAKVVLQQGGGLPEIDGLITDMKEVQRRRKMSAEGVREGVDGDIFLPIPLGHPGDIGLPSTAVDDYRVALSRMKWNPQASDSNSDPQGENP